MLKQILFSALLISTSLHAADDCNLAIYKTFSSNGGTSHPFDFTNDRLQIYPHNSTTQRSDTETKIGWSDSMGGPFKQKKEAIFKYENGKLTSFSAVLHKIQNSGTTPASPDHQRSIDKQNEINAKGFDITFGVDAQGKCRPDKIVLHPQSGSDVVVFDRKLCEDMIPDLNQFKKLKECSSALSKIESKVIAYKKSNSIELAPNIHDARNSQSKSMARTLWAANSCLENLSEDDFNYSGAQKSSTSKQVISN